MTRTAVTEVLGRLMPLLWKRHASRNCFFICVVALVLLYLGPVNGQQGSALNSSSGEYGTLILCTGVAMVSTPPPLRMAAGQFAGHFSAIFGSGPVSDSVEVFPHLLCEIFRANF